MPPGAPTHPAQDRRGTVASYRPQNFSYDELHQKPAGDLVPEGQGIHHAGFLRSLGGVVAPHRRGGGSLSARLSSLASGGMKSRRPCG